MRTHRDDEIVGVLPQLLHHGRGLRRLLLRGLAGIEEILVDGHDRELVLILDRGRRGIGSRLDSDRGQDALRRVGDVGEGRAVDRGQEEVLHLVVDVVRWRH